MSSDALHGRCSTLQPHHPGWKSHTPSVPTCTPRGAPLIFGLRVQGLFKRYPHSGKLQALNPYLSLYTTLQGSHTQGALLKDPQIPCSLSHKDIRLNPKP